MYDLIKSFFVNDFIGASIPNIYTSALAELLTVWSLLAMFYILLLFTKWIFLFVAKPFGWR
jgi:hypothetical protein